MPDIYEKIYEQAQKIDDKNLKDIIATYAKTYSNVANTLKKNLNYKNNPMFSKVSQYMLDKYVSNRFEELVLELKKVVPDGVENSITIAYAEALLSKYIKEDIKNISLEKLMKDAPRTLKNGGVAIQLKEATLDDLIQATGATEYAVKKLIRETFSKHLTIDSMLKNGQKEIAAKIIKDLSGSKLDALISSNMTGIVDKAGRRWNVETYVNMAVRTKFQEAHIEGIRSFVEQYDGHGDLARIPRNQNTIDACKDFEGMIISITGITEGYPTYAELKATNLIFHPNCRHKPKPYWDEESIPKSAMLVNNRVTRKAKNFL